MEQNHATANDRLVVRAELDAHPPADSWLGRSVPATELAVPADIPAGAYTLIVRAYDADGHLRGLRSIPIDVTGPDEEDDAGDR